MNSTGAWVPLGEVDPADESVSQPQSLQTWSEVGGLAHKDFAEFTPDEMTRARIALERLEWIPANDGLADGFVAAARASTCVAR